ncbi:MAG TPA: NADH-quinone oxidoreductase subunit NuoG [Solirubrobacteraceae bacterium]|nr:NADH-quinone oxidoreductase subunit NuoG [Solirubrobacteraceae bacterium]
MPRPQQRTISFTIDGREVQAPENTMLVDAAKHGDVEIPVFCYEPKLGQPVGACRMCLVEIEGIPKLQTGCSTAVKDGMVVHTETERVKTAQRAVVEFLLVNHPLDCPVCDKGGECPLQDITFGWGPGISRFIEPKRHFVKPLALSPRIAIDRERCILCYRCVRFSQDVAEDDQLVLAERGAETFVSTFDGHPYDAPFSGNIIELCPVGALTSRPYRFAARPWDIEDAGSVCTLCPAQCNVHLTVRDERVLRVQVRDNADVDDGWLCDRGRFAYPALNGRPRITRPLLRDGGQLREVSWERALSEAAAALGRAGEQTGAIAGGPVTNEEGLLLSRLLREGLSSPHVDSRAAGTLPLDLHRALGDPALQATVSDLEFAHAALVVACDPITDATILDLRLRKGVRRHGLTIVQATAEELRVRGEELAAQLSGAGEEVVVLWHERLTAGPEGIASAQALLAMAQRLGLAGIDGAGLLEVPSAANGRGLREAGVLPNAGPGLSEAPPPAGPSREGRGADAIAAGLAEGELSAVILMEADPFLRRSRREAWERALGRATTVIAYAANLNDDLHAYADVIFPAQAYAEKEGTLVHPDGRIQRLRPAVAQPGQTRAQWLSLVQLASALGLDLGVRSALEASEQLFDVVAFYAGLTLEEIGGKGVRWQERDAAGAYPIEQPA